MSIRAIHGVTWFGTTVLDLPPEHETWTGPDRAQVYLVMRGSGEIEIEGERFRLEPETVVRIARGARGRLLAGPHGIRLAAMGDA
jgi:mannose-6-phosphate isomerase-like protein (cupin superfamily)